MSPPRRLTQAAAVAAAAAACLLLPIHAAIHAAPPPPSHSTSPLPSPSRHVAAFFYLWYGNPATDGRYIHWDHHVLPHWTEAVRQQYPEARFLPPDDIHAPFYPRRGLYSSRDGEVLRDQFREMAEHGIGVAVVSWWGRPGVSRGDSQGVLTDGAMKDVLDAAHSQGVEVALHLEPYEGRDAQNMRLDIEYLHTHYGGHPALHRVAARGGPSSSSSPSSPPTKQQLPRLYVYDSYHIAPAEWRRILAPDGDLTVRGTAHDASFVGLWLSAQDGPDLVSSSFNGAYTYFASDGFSYGSTTHNWPRMAGFLREQGLDFVPCVAPGYDDTRIRPWNAANRRDREGGAYYRRMWEAALASGAESVAVTTFNEWGEGTQIEPAVPRRVDVDGLAPVGRALNRTMRLALRLSDAYDDYGAAEDGVEGEGEGGGASVPPGPSLYLRLTRDFSRRLVERAARAREEEGGRSGEEL